MFRIIKHIPNVHFIDVHKFDHLNIIKDGIKKYDIRCKYEAPFSNIKLNDFVIYQLKLHDRYNRYGYMVMSLTTKVREVQLFDNFDKATVNLTKEEYELLNDSKLNECIRFKIQPWSHVISQRHVKIND